MTLTVEAWQLRRVLRAALPAVDRDEYNPFLAGLHLEARGGLLVVTATDRYLAVRARVPAEGELSPVVLPAFGARLILRALRGRSRALGIPLRAGPDIPRPGGKGVDPAIHVAADPDLIIRGSEASGFPLKKLRKAWTDVAAEAAQPAASRHIDLAVPVLRRLAAILRPVKPEPGQADAPHIIWTTAQPPFPAGGTPGPILIDAHGWLSVLVMPRRLTRDSINHVPFDLPEATS